MFPDDPISKSMRERQEKLVAPGEAIRASTASSLNQAARELAASAPSEVMMDPALFRAMQPPPPPKNISAQQYCAALRQSVEEFEDQIPSGEQVEATYYTPAGEGIRVHAIGYDNPYLVRFFGVDAGQRPCTVLVHMSSANIVLRSFAITKDEKPRRIGFRQAEPSAETGNDGSDLTASPT